MTYDQEKAQRDTVQILKDCGALLEGHFVLTTDEAHSDRYINKDAVAMHPLVLSKLAVMIAERFELYGIEVVAAPAAGAVSLGQKVATALSTEQSEVLAVYAEREERRLLGPITAQDSKKLQWNTDSPDYSQGSLGMPFGSELVVKLPEFEFKRGYDKAMAGKRVLVVEDILTTGGSVRKVINAVRDCGGDVVATCVIANRGGVTSEQIASELYSLAAVDFRSWPFGRDCPLCAKNVPINTDVGKGKQWLAAHK